jgi:septin 4
VNGYECKVFGASNVELVTKTRTEHLTETDKVKARAPKTPLQSFLGIAEVEEKQAAYPEVNNVSISYEFCTPWKQNLLS